MSKKFTGVRRRVEGERARHAVRVIVGRGYKIKSEGRMRDDTGYHIRTAEGPVINLYDTGSILVSGNDRHLFGDVEELKLPESSSGVLILVSADEDAVSDLCEMLSGWGITHNRVDFAAPGWMESVAQARKRGLHVMALVSDAAAVSNHSGQSQFPGVYFGLGLLVARLSREHFTVLSHKAVDMPDKRDMFGATVLRYSNRVGDLQAVLQTRLQSVGINGTDQVQRPIVAQAPLVGE